MAWATAALALAVVLACVVALRQHRRAAALSVENQRWREFAQQRADRVSVLSHEVRTPLALIAGACELLEDGATGELTQRQRALVDTIGVKSGEMVQLAEDLLADARIDAELFTLHLSSVNVRRLAFDVVSDLRRLHPGRITLSARGAPPRVYADSGLLRQALINLVTNALRHAGDDAHVTVSVRTMEDGVLIVVSDDGGGMTGEQKRDLFRRTLEGKSATGHGLGMLITKRIIELHGGRCLVDTISSKGTAILTFLPLRAAGGDGAGREGVEAP